ncbi:iron ABC transporter permease [Salinisphaera sp.]|uniref:FecCD family ABC transporter permease n=1 Tax=Salinisphaera sp. TaxID=1914330 RepID=UPI000C4EE37D|nr:iron ABC transporter permease [Salinisphaera sp.]MBS62598.1 ABC transporter permease [Salinisphaera sp.]
MSRANAHPAHALAPAGSWRLALGPARSGRSILLDKRACAANLLLAVALLAACVASLCLGEVSIAPRAAIAGLFGYGDGMDVFVVQQLRATRLLAGVLSGGAFALAGCLMQTLARNRLATPGIIGLDNGATAFAVASVLGVGLGIAPPAMALVGASVATAIAFGLAGGIGTQGYRFLVAGIGVGAAFDAITRLMLARSAIDAANAAYPWTVGSLNGVGALALNMLAVGLVIGLIGAAALARALGVVRFSEGVAQGLGIRVGHIRLGALVLSVGLTALAVAVAGPVGLIALIGPEVARHLSSRRGVPLMGSTLAGALLMVVADLAGRVLFSPIEIPVGLISTVVGAPVLLWILLRPGHKIGV